MFYSHTFLARKSPLGTVWIAAHLQHKLRKSHVTVTDIPSSVDCIMFPEVPIALRLSGHLLLGVVRIYSKKVDYLYNDCNDALSRLRTAFASLKDVNLSEDASRAPFHSITLPDTFELDSMDLGEDLYFGRIVDDHLKTQEEITITDQIPVEGDPYVAFFINEDFRIDRSPPAEISETEVTLMEEDVPSVRVDNTVGVSEAGPGRQSAEATQKLSEDMFLSEIEFMRDADHSSHLDNLAELRDLGNDIIEQQMHPEKTTNVRDNLSPISEDPSVSPETEVMRNATQSSNLENRPEWRDDISEQQMPSGNIINKDNLSPIFEDIAISGGQSAEYQLHSDPRTNPTVQESLGDFGSHASLGHVSPQMEIQPTPPVEKKIAKVRKRKQYFDESIVLTNESIKEGLKDASKLVRKRKKLPCSALDFWRFNNRSKKDHIFLEPLNSGLCTNIRNIFNKEFITSKVYIIPEEPEVAPTLDPDIEIEQLRFEEPQVDNYLSPTFMPSSSGQKELPDIPPSNIGSEPQTEVPRTPETEIPRTPTTFEPTTFEPTTFEPTFEQTTFTEPVDFDMETPFTHLEEQVGLQHTGFSDIPGLLNSAEAEDLTFLEADNTPAAGHAENEEVDTLSVRTRAVAQYFKKQSPTTGSSNDHSENLSLNKILEGKTRKHCARMFYETLVLKSYGLIDVQQDEAYGDVTLVLNSSLTKATF